jgi:transposase
MIMAKRKLPRDPELLELSKTLTCREIAQRYDVNLHYAYQMLRRLCQRPPREELADALERWGMDGCAEEYEVDTAQIAAWMRELDL